MGVQSAATTRVSRNRFWACTCGPASWAELAVRVDRGRNFLCLLWLARLVGLPNGRVSTDGSPRQTDDGRVVRDFKLEPTVCEVQSRKAVPRAVYWFERGGFLVLTGTPRPVLRESCTTCIEDIAIFPPPFIIIEARGVVVAVVEEKAILITIIEVIEVVTIIIEAILEVEIITLKWAENALIPPLM